MCGRYYLIKRIYEVLKDMEMDVASSLQVIGDCRPHQMLPVIIQEGNHCQIKMMQWGYTINSKLIINVRSETILDKTLFREDIQNRRCLIIAKGFYEWDIHKHLISFEPMEDILLMAGCYNKQGEFVIITKEANDVMQPVHSRMPVMLSPYQINSWFDQQSYQKYLQCEIPFHIVSGILQQSLF